MELAGFTPDSSSEINRVPAGRKPGGIGGKPDSAMGGGTDKLKLDDALASVDDFVAAKLS